MKKITVIIQPSKFDNLKKNLIESGICGLTISNVEGYGIEKSKLEMLKDKDISVEILPKIKIEIVIKDDEVESVINTIIKSVRTGRIGDGKIFITDVVDVIRIRTGERKEDAL